MSDFTPVERASQRRIVGMIIQGNPARKAHYDQVVTKLVKTMRDVMPEALDSVLAEYATSVAYVAAVLSKTPVGEISPTLDELFNNYSLAAATLIGVYDPESSDLPSAESTDLGTILGMDRETFERFQEFNKQEQAKKAGAAPTAADRPGQYI